MPATPRPPVPHLEEAVLEFQTSESRRAELFASTGSLPPSLSALSVQIPSATFRRNLTFDLPRIAPPSVGADLVRGLQVVDVSRIFREQLSPVLQITQSFQQFMEIYAGVAEQLAQPARLVQDWFDAYRPVFQTIAASLAAFGEEQEVRAAGARAFAERHGWPLPLLLFEHAAFSEIVRMVDAPKREVSGAMRHAFRPGTRARHDAFQAIRESDHFGSRRPIINQAARAMARGEWYLVINALLPMLEGVLVEVAFPAGQRPDRGAVLSSLDAVREEGTEGALASAAFASLETLLTGAGAGSAIFSRFDPNAYGVPGEPRSLNRHAILHGAARRYGTADNALKLFLLLVVMLEALPPPTRS